MHDGKWTNNLWEIMENQSNVGICESLFCKGSIVKTRFSPNARSRSSLTIDPNTLQNGCSKNGAQMIQRTFKTVPKFIKDSITNRSQTSISKMDVNWWSNGPIQGQRVELNWCLYGRGQRPLEVGGGKGDPSQRD